MEEGIYRVEEAHVENFIIIIITTKLSTSSILLLSIVAQ